ncbi:phage tail tape measure protein [Latilactobacillus curvatus]|uniref:phage tail tape measure protein n=1 Tax=Latilactobacillus curvatus TaxID=28038 RepID=UPI00241125B7|nr:phage tail tape measure protein [Latilactobacillus curvatus]
MAAAGRPLGSMVVSLGMDGSKFETGLKNIQNQFKLAKSEMKANLSVLSSTESAYDKAAGRVDGLTKVMSVNDRQIETLTKSYKEQVRINGEYSDTAQKTGAKINNLVREQANYKRQLDDAKIAMREAERGTQSYQNALSRQTREMKANLSVLSMQGKETEASRTKYQSLGRQLDDYNKLIGAEKSKLEDLISIKGKDAQQTLEQKTKIVELTSEQKKAQYQYDELGKSVKNMSEKNARAVDSLGHFSTKTKEVGEHVSSAGHSLTGFSTLAVGAFTIGTVQATKFQHTMQVVKNNIETGGESAKAAIKGTAIMTKDAEQFSTKYGISVQKISEGYLDLVKRGYDSNQAIGSMNTLLQGSIASGDDFNDVIKVTTSTLESFNMRSSSTAGMMKNTTEVTNKLAFVADKTSTGFQDLGIGMSYVGGSAYQAGLSLSETASSMGLLSNNGLEADKAGTGLRKVINSLVSPTKTGQAALDEYGISIKDANGQMRPLSNIMGQFQQKLSGLSKTKKLDLFHGMFGTTGQQAGLILEENGNKIGELADETDRAAKSNYAATLSAKNMQTAQNQMNKFKETANILAIQFSTTLLPALTSVTNGISKLMGKLTEMPEGARKITAFAILGAAALGPLLIGIGALIKSVGAITGAVKGLIGFFSGGSWLATTLTGPVGIAALAIAGLATGFVLAYKKFKPFHDLVNSGVAKFKAISKAISDLFTNSFSSKKASQATSILTKLLPMGTLGPTLAGINKIKTTLNGLKTLGTGVGTTLAGAAKKVANAFKAMFQVFNGSKAGAKALQNIFPKPVANTIIALTKQVRASFNSMGTSIKNIVSSISKTITPIFKGIGKIFSQVIGSMVNYWHKNGNDMKQAFTNIFGGILIVVTAKIKAVLSIVSVVLKVLSATISAILNVIRNVFSQVFGSLQTIVKGALNIIQGVFSVFAGVFTGNWSKVWSGVKQIFKGIWDTFKGIVGGVLNVISGLVNSGIDGINWLTSKFGAKAIGHIPSVKWATGTTKMYPNGVPTNQIATVNDGGKKEMVIYPNGQAVIPDGWNTQMFLPKGSHVINGDDTERLTTGHYYKNGTLGNIGSALSGVFGKIKDSISFVGNVIAHPIKYLKQAFESKLNLGGKTSFVIENVKGVGGYVINAVKDKIVEALKSWKTENDTSEPSGSGVARWRSSVKKALGMLNLSTSQSMIAKVLRQIQTESGGNPKAVGGDDGYVSEGKATGLMQVKPGTFNAYKLKGHGNIMNGFDNLLAGLNYAKHRYGSDLSFLGKGHGYENGGFIYREQIARIGEGNKAEAVVPLTNRTRAMQILAQIKDRYGLDGGSQLVLKDQRSTATNNDSKILNEIARNQQIMIEMFRSLLQMINTIIALIQANPKQASSTGLVSQLGDLLDQAKQTKKQLKKYQLG